MTQCFKNTNFRDDVVAHVVGNKKYNKFCGVVKPWGRDPPTTDTPGILWSGKDPLASARDSTPNCLY